MKMIRAIVRPEMSDNVTEGLADAGFYSMTKMPVFGRGKQKGFNCRKCTLRRTTKDAYYNCCRRRIGG